MPGLRARGRSRGRGSFRGRFQSRGRRTGRSNFTSSRVKSPVNEDLDDAVPEQLGEGNATELQDEESNESDDEIVPLSRPYSQLLQSLNESYDHGRPRSKRRKLKHDSNGDTDVTREQSPPPEEEDAADDEDGLENGEDEEEANHVPEAEGDDFEDDEDASDAFDSHFANPTNQLQAALSPAKENQWRTHLLDAGIPGKLSLSVLAGSDVTKPIMKARITSVGQMKLKKRLVAAAEKMVDELVELDRIVSPYLYDYHDMLFGARTVENIVRLRRLVSLHAINHVFKTRDRVIKNTARLAREADAEAEDIEFRDQGFTRPKVLVLLETRQACVRFMDAIIDVAGPEQQENRKRFYENFSQPEGKFPDDTPEDHRELFDGNDDNEFRIGIKFTRKTVKYFSPFYSSDMIFASPLGLRRAIESTDPKKKDCDFLSSIEIVVVDQADAMLMQNWEHVEFVFDHLNLQPKEAHGCDFSRVRSLYLDGHAKCFRQTVVFSAYLTPELNNLFSKHMLNVAGKLKYQPHYDGSLIEFGLEIKQIFSRFESASPVVEPDARFKYFTTAVVPSLSKYPRPAEGGRGILIFIPSYLDFVRIRNYFATSPATQNMSFGAISEYTELSDSRRARSHFLSGRHSVLLYTGRAHHFRRYQIKGAKRVIMYGLPDNPIFYRELVAGFLGVSIQLGKLDASEAVVRVMYSRWDGLKLERIVGSKRVASMLRDEGGATFEFV